MLRYITRSCAITAISLLGAIACLQARVPVTPKESSTQIVRIQPQALSLALTGTPHSWKVTWDSQGPKGAFREQKELPWNSGATLELAVPKDPSLTHRYELEIRDEDRYLLARATGQSKALIGSWQPEWITVEAKDRLWDQDIRVIFLKEQIESSTIPEEEDTYFAVSDIFAKHNCIVCHNDPLTFDLRQFPFRFVESKFTSLTQLNNRILERIESDEMPPEGLPRVTGEEKQRLRNWAAKGFAPAPPSPLTKPQGEEIEGEVWVTYEVLGAKRGKGTIPLAYHPIHKHYRTLIKGLPRGAMLSLSYVRKIPNTHADILLKTQSFSLGEDELKLSRFPLEAF